jgi:hypothetical protein
MIKSRRKPGPRCGLSILALVTSGMCAAPAFATLIGFETLPAEVHLSGTSITEASYRMLFIEGPVAASFGSAGSTGALINGADPFSCDLVGCPSGANGRYLSILNDGAVQLTSIGSSSLFTLNSFNFVFVPPLAEPLGDGGRMVLDGVNESGSTVSTSLDFSGPKNDGLYWFGAASLDAGFLSTRFSSLSFSACLNDGFGGCFNSVDNPAFNQAQFAIDDIDLTAVPNAVPEPDSYWLAGFALAALGMTRRRSSARSTSL